MKYGPAKSTSFLRASVMEYVPTMYLTWPVLSSVSRCEETASTKVGWCS